MLRIFSTVNLHSVDFLYTLKWTHKCVLFKVNNDLLPKTWNTKKSKFEVLDQQSVLSGWKHSGSPCSTGLRSWKEAPTYFWLYPYPAAKAVKGDPCWRWNGNECQFSGMIWDVRFWDRKSNNWDNYKTTKTNKNQNLSYSFLPPRVKPDDIIPFLLLLLLKYMSYRLWLGEKCNRVPLVVIITRGLKANKRLQWQLQ